MKMFVIESAHNDKIFVEIFILFTITKEILKISQKVCHPLSSIYSYFNTNSAQLSILYISPFVH